MTSAREDFQDTRGHFVADVNLPSQDLANGLHQDFSALLLHHVAAAAGAQDPLGVKGFVVHGDDQDGQARLECLHILDQLQAMLVREGDVHERKVRSGAGNKLKGLLRSLGFATGHQIWLVVNQLGQALAHHRVVIHDEHGPFGLFLFLSCGHRE